MKRSCIFLLVLYLISAAFGQTQICEKEKKRSGEIYGSLSGGYQSTKCWIIEVPQDMYVRLDFIELTLTQSYSCSQVYVKIIVAETYETYTYCPKDTSDWNPVTALSDVNITLSHYGHYRQYTSSSFKLKYHIEDLTCAQKNHFRCSIYSCIHGSKVCDGIEDCKNGKDEIGCEKGILAVKGVNASRENVIRWLKNQRSAAFGWGKNTHRAITAIFLADAASFRGRNLEDELMAKQLELLTSVSLLRNSSDPLSVSELSMFINALTVTCHNSKRFYGYNLLQILGEGVSTMKSPSPGAYLTLCNSNWTISRSDIRKLIELLDKDSEYPFLLDVQAVTVMALTCIKKKTQEFTNIVDETNIYNETDMYNATGIHNAIEVYNATIDKFIAGQLSDGSFGNVYTTALVTQALIASGQENNKRWNVNSTVQYLMKQLNSTSVDFLSAYLTLPIFSGKSLVDLETVNCGNTSRKQDEDDEISDVTNKLGGKMRVQYSLYVGDQKDVIHTIYLRMPNQSTAYDVMRMAQTADPKYKFLHRDVSGRMYVYEIAGITNDPEAGKFWLLYSKNSNRNETLVHYTKSPDEFILEDKEHLIMWYKSAHF